MSRLIRAVALAALCAAALLAPRAAGVAEELPWVEVPLRIEPSVEFKFRTPRDGIGGKGTVRGNWLDVTRGTLPLKGVKGGPMRFELIGSVLGVDLDGDGKCENAQKQDVYGAKALYDGGATNTYVFRLRRDDQQWFFQRACMAVGEIAKTRVALIDDDNDGRWDGIGKDVVRVGSATGAGYLGRLLPVGGKLYEVAVDPAGLKLKYRARFPPEAEGAPGTLDLWSGYKAKAKPAIAVVKKVDAAGLFFECNVKGGVPVPPGEYELHEAIVGPTRDQVGLVLKGRMANIVVKPGETTTLDWGLPGVIDFSCTKEGTLLDIEQSSIATYGKAGEKYDKFEPAGIHIGCEVVDAASKQRIWYGGVGVATNLRLQAAKGPWLVRLVNDNVPYLGTFQSEWR